METAIDALFRRADGRAPVVMPLENRANGMREFGIEEPDGDMLIFAHRLT